jgi:hypothetical protein
MPTVDERLNNFDRRLRDIEREFKDIKKERARFYDILQKMVVVIDEQAKRAKIEDLIDGSEPSHWYEDDGSHDT